MALVERAGQAKHTLLSDGPLADGVLVEYVFAAQAVQKFPSQYRPGEHTQSENSSDPAELVEAVRQDIHDELSEGPNAARRVDE